jgi:hypothetical protein
MNTAYIKYPALMAACMLIAACTKDVKVALPDYPTQLVIHSNNTSYSNALYALTATVGKSVSILKYNGLQTLSVSNAKIDVYTEGQYVATMQHDPSDDSYYSSIVPEEGKTYTLKASAPGFENIAEATAKVNTSIPIKGLTHIVAAKFGSNGPEDEVTITFDDPAGQTNYYMVSFLSPGTDDHTRQYYSNICVNTLDPSIETIDNQDFFDDNDNNCLYGDLFLKDELFNGQSKQIKFYINTYSIQPYENDMGDTVYSSVVLTHVSEDYYRYRKTAAAASTTQGNPFAEPSNVYTNVKNGRGIFSIAIPYIAVIK